MARRRRITGVLAVGTSTVAIGLSLSAVDGQAGATVADANVLPALPAVAVASPEFIDFLDRACLGCHTVPAPEGDLDLLPLLERLRTNGAASLVPGDRSVLRDLRARLADRSMPPSRRKPSDEEYEASIAAIDAIVAAMPQIVDPSEFRRRTVRRLTRVEYANSVRDLFGVDFDPAVLPPDEIGHGFDTNGDAAGMAPLRFEQSVDAAEQVAAMAVTAIAKIGRIRRVSGADLEATGRNQSTARGVRLNSSGAAVARFDVHAAGRYRVWVRVSADQAGDELVRMQLRRDRRVLVEQSIDGQNELRTMKVEVDLDSGPLTLAAAFVNDYWNPEHQDPRQRDRNAFVASIELEGPVAAAAPTALQHDLAARFGELDPDRRWRAAVRYLAERAWRRPLTDDETRRLVDAVEAASRRPVADLPEDPAWAGQPDPERIRTAIVAVLAHPRFLFLLEAEPETDAAYRDIDGHEYAARLAAFLWSSVPDEVLAEDAGEGRLDTPDGRRAAVRRLLADPRSLALSEHFAAQWLQIRRLDERSPDTDRFPGVDPPLLASMRAETVLLFDEILRHGRPVSDLVSAPDTFLDGRLARHYGIAGVRGEHMRRIALEGLGARAASPPRPGAAATGLGVLRHGSVLLATSNPTRTSPVKRGKWVLEALLDDPPPPAPAFVPSLPRDGEPSADASLRELLEVHRDDPNCSACHRRMDPLGFALESFDAVGRPRGRDASGIIDDAATLPDGTRFNGPEGLRDLLLGPRSRDFVRSIVRHLAIFALGRGLDAADEAWVEAIVDDAGPDPALADLVVAVAECPPMRVRVAADEDINESDSNPETGAGR